MSVWVVVVSYGRASRNTEAAGAAGQQAAHVFAGFTFIEQLTGFAANLVLLPNTEHSFNGNIHEGIKSRG